MNGSEELLSVGCCNGGMVGDPKNSLFEFRKYCLVVLVCISKFWFV